MKSLRNILLERYTDSEHDLDAIRQGVLAPLRKPRLNWITTLWREIVLPARISWTTLSALGCVALVLNAVSSEPQSTRLTPSPRFASPSEARRVQAQLLAELFDTVPPTQPPSAETESLQRTHRPRAGRTFTSNPPTA